MISLCTPTRDSFNSGFTFDLVRLVQHEKDVVFLVSQGTLLCNQRTELVKESLKLGVTHIFFVDSDMRFPKDMVERLVKHDKDIVGANCIQRGTDKPTAVKDNLPLSSKEKTGVEEIDSLGCGVLLIKKEVFEMPETWFATPYDGEKFVGEDRFFCRKAKENGFKIWVDHDLSQEIKHVGNYEYGI